MKVLKFGGTSVGSAQRMKEVAKLITDGEQKIVVLSAMSGTTNTLVEISDYLYKKNPEGANEIINRLEAKYKQHVNELYSTDEYKQKTQEFIKAQFDYIRSYTKDIFTLFEEKVILAQGELISTNMVTNYLQEQGVNAILLPALEFMRTDKNSEPDPVYIKEKLAAQLEIHPDAEIYITQGFICRNAYGEIDNLQRGGSDYTASLIGAAVNASEIQIWTDIDGMHDNDPRIVDKTSPVRHLHFEEAAELAYFGAKILHPTCVQPAKYANIPVRLLNTMEPTAPGTLISNDTEKGKIKAVAAKDNITAIKIKSSRMLLAHGFLRKVFEIFESYPIVEQIAKDLNCTVDELIKSKELRSRIDIKKYVTPTVGLPTLTDIMQELDKPGRDPRQQIQVFEFDKNVKTIEDLTEGMELPGIVNNITNFGCFVDIGIKEKGLVHVSQLADKFVSDPTTVVSIHQHVRVKVMSIDLERKRIQLTMKGLNQ